MGVRRVATVAALLALVACERDSESQQTAAPVPPASPTAAAVTTSAGPTIRQWLAVLAPKLEQLAASSAGLQGLSQSPAANRSTLLTLADSARLTAIAARSQPPPTDGQVEAEVLTRSVEEVEAEARSAASCVSACNATYSSLLSAVISMNSAIERMAPLVQAGR